MINAINSETFGKRGMFPCLYTLLVVILRSFEGHAVAQISEIMLKRSQNSPEKISHACSSEFSIKAHISAFSGL